jgi:hypothetical protein
MRPLPLFASAALLSVALLLANAQPEAGQPRCAVFGADLAPRCLSFPNWQAGNWTPPKGIPALHVLVVGGGGGGAATIQSGIGGTGGGSGGVRTETIPNTGQPVFVRVGHGGRGGRGFCRPGHAGGPSFYGDTDSAGGEGGSPISGGGSEGEASSGGGGAGGGFYHDGHGGPGGAGGTAGGDGAAGKAGTDSQAPVHPSFGGHGKAFPPAQFTQVTAAPGPGGTGGAYGSDSPGYGGGGGGGGGGILLQGAGGPAAPGASGRGDDTAHGGAGGQGFGAGGGGGGNYVFGAAGGSGATGVVYVEWSPALIARN